MVDRHYGRMRLVDDFRCVVGGGAVHHNNFLRLTHDGSDVIDHL